MACIPAAGNAAAPGTQQSCLAQPDERDSRPQHTNFKRKVMSQVVTVDLKQEQDFRFAIHFADGIPVLYGDEAPPLGKGTGPNPAQLLAAAVGNCLSDSLLFAIRKFKQNPEPIQTTVAATIDRNAENRLRVQGFNVRLTLGVPAHSLEHVDRAIAQFEEFCTVGQSVRQGIPIAIEVHDSEGKRLK
jgi:uncharacterized OsmC-like protein